MRKATAIITIMATISMLCVTHTYAQMLIMLSGDTLRGPIKKVTEYDGEPTGDWRIKRAYIFDTMRKEMRGDIYMNLAGEMSIIGRELIKHNSNGHCIESSLFCTDGSPCTTRKITYNKIGRTAEHYYAHYMLTTKEWPGKCNNLLDNLTDGITEWFDGIDSVTELSYYEYNEKSQLIRTKTEKIIAGSNSKDNKTTEINYTYDDDGGKAHVLEKAVRLRALNSKPDTLVSYKEAQYDSHANLTTEWVLEEKNYPRYIYWESDGRKVSTKNTYKYDERNNRIEARNYFREESTHADEGSEQTGLYVGLGERHTYDSQNNRTSITEFSIYLQNDGTEKEYIKEQRELPDRNNSIREKGTLKDVVVRDSYGNIIKKISDNHIEFTYEIEYFE